MRLKKNVLLLAIPVLVLLLPIYSVAGEQETVQAEGILVPFNGPTACDWGFTHYLRDPCTGEFIRWVTLFTSTYDCQHVFFEGLDDTPSVHCPSILPAQAILTLPPCLIQVVDLIVRRIPDGHRVDWSPFPCADSYDLIRGTASGLTTQDLGVVTCVENDTPLTRANDFSGDEPLPGEVFFYLVRPNGPIGFEHYGYSSSESMRVPISGDCSTD